MMTIVKSVFVAFMSFSGGMLIASGIFAFITAIGVIPSIIFKTKTSNYIIFFEECIIWGGIFATSQSFIDYKFNIGGYLIGKIFIIFYGLCVGIFIGVLASSIAETIDVIPILYKRTRIGEKVGIIIITLALGKLLGSVIYFLNTGFQR